MTITEASAQTTIPHDYSKRAMVFGGRSSQDLAAKIAGKLSLAEKTIKNYVSQIYSKLSVERRSQAARLATERRLRKQQG